MKEILKTISIIFLYLIGYKLQNIYYLNCLLISIMIFGIYLFFKSIFEIKIIILFILLYVFNYLEFSLFGKILSVYTQYNTFSYLYKCGLLMWLFLAIFFQYLGVVKYNNITLRKFPSKIIEIFNLILVIYFIFTGVKGKIGNYSEVYLSPKIEYLIIPYLQLFIFSTKKINLRIVNIIYILLIIYLILIGVRSPAIQLFLILLVINRNYLKKYRNNIGVIFIILGIFFMKIVGRMRNFTYNNSWISLFFYKKSNIIVNNEADVIYSGTALIGLIEEGILTLKESILTIKGLIFNFFRIHLYHDYSTIATLIQKNTPTGGGGIISSNLYYLGREIAVILVALMLGKILKNLFLNRKNNNIYTIYGVIVFVTIVRWFCYSIFSLYKMGIYAIIFYFFNKIIFLFLKKIKRMI